MNELEKCMAGEWYDCHNEIFLEYKNHARELLAKYNSFSYNQKKEKTEVLKQLFGSIRKREERKDRLHQNYLKRKASGAQKRYEDKIKKRKKAEIEAKKAAIRAEDIAKGVFVPVSSLPQREPMKGVQTA